MVIGEMFASSSGWASPAERDQPATRSSPRFAELRARVYPQIQRGRQRRAADTPH